MAIESEWLAFGKGSQEDSGTKANQHLPRSPLACPGLPSPLAKSSLESVNRKPN